MKKTLLIVCLFISVIASGQNNFFWSHNSGGKYGYLYNWYAVSDARNIANTGWHATSNVDWNTLQTYIGGASNGGKLKQVSFNYWESPNTGATNELGFNGKGVGIRSELGTFTYKKQYSYFATNIDGPTFYARTLSFNNSTLDISNTLGKRSGFSVRLVKDATSLTHGQTGTYMGNDGRIYQTICIGTQEWVAENLVETKYRNGDLIPIVTDNTAWAALTTGARCVYENIESNK